MDSNKDIETTTVIEVGPLLYSLIIIGYTLLYLTLS